MATKKETNKIPLDKLALYDQLIETNPSVVRKGATMPYTSHDGNMFSFLSPAGTLAIRLSEKDRMGFLKKYKTTLMEAHGTIMKEYVMVPENLQKKIRELKTYFDASYAYVTTLKPKSKKSG